MSKRIILRPTAGFVIKTTNDEPGVYSPSPSAPSSSSSSSKTLEPTAPKPIVLTKGFKVFLNIAYESNVPAPPDASESEIRKAMMGDERSRWFVPVVVSDGREMLDKAGKPSLVFDAVFSERLRERISKDPEFKTYIIELALERVEEKSGLVLGREVATPNLKSKGPLDEPTVLVPAQWATPSSSTTEKKPLIEEVSPAAAASTSTSKAESKSIADGAGAKQPLKSALKKSASATTTTTPPSSTPNASDKPNPSIPKWTLEIESTGTARSARIEIFVPLMTRDDYDQTSLDLEPNRLIFTCGGDKYGTLDVPLLSSSSSSASNGKGEKEGNPKERRMELDIDTASAEWRIGEGRLILRAPVLVV